MTYSWKIHPVDEKKVMVLQKQLKIHPTLCRLLVQRGIETYHQAKTFFRPSTSHLHSPWLMWQMDVAVHRIQVAIDQNQTILIYGDYDVDGTTSVALLYTALKKRHSNVQYYIPDREKEGYGVSEKVIYWAEKQNISLIISLDCGIKAVKPVQIATERGIDFIICDHHTPSPVLPNAIAILNPKQKKCTYPYTELSGCGITFKLVQALHQKWALPHVETYAYLDLVVISIAADIVPITGENRTLAFLGLEILKTTPRPSIAMLKKQCNLKQHIHISDIVFKIAPRINAAGRMEHAHRAVELLISQDKQTAKAKVEHIEHLNAYRQTIDARMTAEALEMIAQDPHASHKKTTVLYAPNWHKGIIGIMASRMIEHHYRPTIIFTTGANDLLVGSARSVKGFDIYRALEACQTKLVKFGGHKYAAGLTIKKENLDAFTQQFEQTVSSTISDKLLLPEISIDAILYLKEINMSFYHILSQFAPFGPSNRRPVFLSKKVSDKGSKIVKQKHLKIKVSQDGETLASGIAFNQANSMPLIQQFAVDVCYKLIENTWNGFVNIDMQVLDIKKN